MSVPHQRVPGSGDSRERSRSLSQRECRSWVGAHRQGRLGYHTGRGPRAVVVNYGVADDQVVFRLPDYSEIIQYAMGEQVTLEVAGALPVTGRSETVTVTGEAHQADKDDIVTAAHLDEAWPPGVSTRVICIPLTTLRGTETPSSTRGIP